MSRRSRVEYAGAIYHVINRGNYRSFIFETEGARRSFLECLDVCCKAQGWLLHAWVLMGNHYHLCLETPEANLVEGMKWLQSTFANRFNRYRKANGHVFQGRYKAILLDGDAVGSVCHYIHLNPVRANLVDCTELQTYEPSSFNRLWYPAKRRAHESLELALDFAGGLKDTQSGRCLYRDYLSWLSEKDSEKKRLGFETMCRGWAKGTDDFRKGVLDNLKDETVQRVSEAEASEMREPRWERAVMDMLSLVGHKDAELASSPKGIYWKVAIARLLRERYLVPNRWIAERLKMGQVSTVQSLVSRHRTHSDQSDEAWESVQNHETLG
ncbi:MAG TPA: transposase [Opitutae bacterium]|nr:transposase [Opitutae bacterium]